MDSSKRQVSIKREVATCLLVFNHVTLYTHDEHHRSPSVCHRSSRSPGRVEGDEGGGSVLRTGIACVTPLKVRLYSLRGRVSVPPCLLRLCCAASVHPSGGVGAGRTAHQSSSFSCITIPRIYVCSCKASSFVLRMNAARGRLTSITVKVSNLNRAFLWTSEKRCVTHASESRAGWVSIRYTCREWLCLTSLHTSPWMLPIFSMGTFLCSSLVHT